MEHGGTFSCEQRNLIQPGASLKKCFPTRPSSDSVLTTGYSLGSPGAGLEVPLPHTLQHLRLPASGHILFSMFFGIARCEGLLLEHKGYAWKLLLPVWSIASYRVALQVITDTVSGPLRDTHEAP